MTENVERARIVASDLLDLQAADRPGDEFVLFADRESWTFAETRARAHRIAGGLVGLGVEPGECVSVLLPNGPEAVETMLGIWCAGAVYAPLNLAYRGAMLEHTLNLAASLVLVAHVDVVDRLTDLDLEHLRTVIVVGGSCIGDPGADRTTVPYERLVRSSPVAVKRSEWDTACLIYTSGTTGPSKAVLQPYAYYDAFASTMYAEMTAADRYFGYLPLFHTGGVSMIYGMLQRGGAVVVVDVFSPRTYWSDVRRLGITSACIMGSMGAFLERQPATEADTDHSMRVAMMGPMVDDVAGFSTRFGVDIFTEYGTTEVGIPFRSPVGVTDPLTCGRLVDGYEVRLVDEHDIEVPIGEPGELIVRHARPWTLNVGYRSMPEQTAHAWRNGWFHTGDLFRVDVDGNYFFVDRTKDAIRRRGENISSLEVENELMAHPDVELAAVVGVPSGEGVGEEEVKAVLVARAGSTPDPADVIEFLTPRMPHFMVPRYIEFVDELPVTPTLKVRKIELREAGITGATWDREVAGVRVRRDSVGRS